MAKTGTRGRRPQGSSAHDCLLYRSRAQMLAAIQRSVELALTAGERTLLILLREDAAEIVQRLQQAGFDVSELETRGALLIQSPGEYRQVCATGSLSDCLLTRLRQGKDTFSGTLIIVDAMIWPTAIHHEDQLDVVAGSEAVRILCLYHLTSQIPAAKVIYLMQRHGHTALDGGHSGGMPGSEQVGYLVEAASLLLQNEDEAVYLADADGRLLLYNEAAGALLGKRSQQVRGRHLSELLPTSMWGRISHAEQQALESGGPVTFRLEVKMRGKSRSWLVTSGGYSGGESAGYTFGIIRDVTEQKRTEQKLRFTAQLMNVIGQAVIATDRRGIIIFWNRAAEELYGWRALEVLGQNVVEVLGNHISRDQDADIMKSLGEGHSWSGDFLVRRRDGTQFLAHFTDTPIHDDQGRLVGIIGISHDVTERRRAEEELATSQERFWRYFELGLIGISISSPERRIIDVNEKVCELFGYSRQELLAMRWPELIHPEDVAASDAAVRRILSKEIDNYTLEKRFIRKDGQIIDAVVSVGCLRRKDGSVDSFIAMLQDVSDRKRAEREIAAYQQQLRLMTAEMYRMEEEERKHLAVVLHDQIGQNLALSKMKLESLKTTEGRGVLLQEIRGISVLLDDVIQKTRSLTTELRPPVLHELGLRAAVESLCEEFQVQTGLEIHYHDDGTNPPLPEPVSTVLFRGARELLMNVAKHAKATAAEVFVATADGQMQVTVSDNGRGFAPKKSRLKGSFGLFSLTERLRHLGGSIEVTSARGQGSRVRLSAPLELAPLEGEGAGAAAPGAAVSPATAPKRTRSRKRPSS